MRLYRTPGGAWAGTQADAREACLYEGILGSAWTEIDVPTDKPGLLAWLNRNAGPATVEAARAEAELDKIKERDAVATIRSEHDQPSRDVDVESAIHSADYPRSIRLAECALWRLNEHVAAVKAHHQ